MLNTARMNSFLTFKRTNTFRISQRFISRSRFLQFQDDENTTNLNGKELVPQFGDSIPRLTSVIALPILRRPIFPGFMTAIIIKNEQLGNALLDSDTNYVGLFLRKDKVTGLDEAEKISSVDDVYSVGTFAQIQSATKTPLGVQLLLIGHRRINLNEITSLGPPCVASITHWKRSPKVEQTQRIKAYSNEVVQATRDLIAMNPLAHEHIQQWVRSIDLSDPYKLADFAAAMTTSEPAELQKLLECEDIEERLSLALTLLSKERELAKLQMEIKKQVEEKITEQQRKYFLQEQYKNIRQELGMDKDDKEELLGKYVEKVKAIEERSEGGTQLHPDVLRTIRDEMQKLGSLERNSPEFNVTRSYLDWLTAIPWRLLTQDRLDLRAAAVVLDRDHFGLEDVKKRILEFIAVGKLKKSVKGKIICMIGPPGVGKTSIAKSIASALDRKFFRFSVGGLTDIAEIKGHRRTYIGAMPGKPIQCLKSTGSSNPLILIDEIDKLGRGYNGDPASALLELLDPNQNSSFIDHYLDVPVDFSDVLFVCTANDESTIPGPLKDRMEVIRLSGYDIPEKVAIASRYLVPKALAEAGFMEPDSASQVRVEVTDDALEALVKNYCRESGVRSLEKQIEKIARKIAYNSVSQQETASEANTETKTATETETETETSAKTKTDAKFPEATTSLIRVTSSDLETYLGKPKYAQDNIYESKNAPLPVGIVMGLAWSPLGGSPIFIETAAIPTTPSDGAGGVNVVTGQLGSVMRESVNIAYTYARQFVSKR